MVHYNKSYEKALILGVESLLGFLYKASDEFVIKKFNRTKLFREIREKNKNITNTQLSKTFYELKRHKYIEIEEADSNHAVRLTNKAKIKIIEKIAKKSSADKKYRYVSFDIPERLHDKRDLFRNVIKRMGFRQIQQSLWVTDKNIGGMVEIVAEEYDVSDYVAYIISETSNINDHVKKILTKK